VFGEDRASVQGRLKHDSHGFDIRATLLFGEWVQSWYSFGKELLLPLLAILKHRLQYRHTCHAPLTCETPNSTTYTVRTFDVTQTHSGSTTTQPPHSNHTIYLYLPIPTRHPYHTRRVNQVGGSKSAESQCEMTTPLLIGFGAAGVILGARAIQLAYLRNKANPAKGLAYAKRFYEGGFESPMSKREASLILGIR